MPGRKGGSPGLSQGINPVLGGSSKPALGQASLIALSAVLFIHKSSILRTDNAEEARSMPGGEVRRHCVALPTELMYVSSVSMTKEGYNSD